MDLLPFDETRRRLRVLGVGATECAPYLLDFLLTTVPKLSRVAVLVTPTSTTYRAISESVQTAAQKASVKTLVAEASSSQEIDNAFFMMAQEKADAVIVGNSSFFTQERRQIAELALKYRMPSMFGNRRLSRPAD